MPEELKRKSEENEEENVKEENANEKQIEKKTKIEQEQEDKKDYFIISSNNLRRAYVNLFNKAVYVNIREFYEDKKTGEEKPGSKGIALNLDQWNSLKEQIEEIKKAVENASENEQIFTLAESKKKVSISTFKKMVLVNFREYYEDKKTGEEKPGNKGIALNAEQWENFQKYIDDLDKMAIALSESN